MDLRRIMIREAPGQYESLALSLRAVTQAAGVDLDYDEVCAALGVPFAAVATTATPWPGRWMTYGRDAFIGPAARLFGLELRELHPPDVAVDMLSAEEYPQHYEVSYKPLIRQAIENGQPVLVWQGWPDLLGCFWGVVMAVTGELFEGTTLRGGGRLQPLVQPALQCYVVERCEPRRPPADELLATAFRHADAYLKGSPLVSSARGGASPVVVAGAEAFSTWRRWLATAPFKDPALDPHWRDHRQLAELIAAARLSAVRFLRRQRSAVPRPQRQIVDRAIACCESQMNRLADSWNVSTLCSLWGTGHGRKTLLEMIDCLEADDRRLAINIEQLACPSPASAGNRRG